MEPIQNSSHTHNAQEHCQEELTAQVLSTASRLSLITSTDSASTAEEVPMWSYSSVEQHRQHIQSPKLTSNEGVSGENTEGNPIWIKYAIFLCFKIPSVLPSLTFQSSHASCVHLADWQCYKNKNSLTIAHCNIHTKMIEWPLYNRLPPG